MFKPNELERFSMIFEPQMKAAEERIMADVIRRLKINGEITRAADWQIHRAYELGLSKRKVSKIIQQEMGITYKQVKTMYRQVMQLGYSRDEKLYKYKGIAQVPFEKNEGLQQLISAVAEQTYENMQNITQSLGFAVRNDAGKLIFSPLADYYQQTLDAAMLDISSGAFDYNTVLKRVVRELTNSGLRTIDYATGWKNRVDVASRRAVITGMSQLTAKVNEDNAEQLGTDQFEIEWHGGARPEHWWGGMVMSKKELRTKCGLGTVTGLCGVNCYHDYYPFIPGISERSYTDEELEELNRKENTPVEYGGKTYTKYEATQRQRKMETTMRAQRERIALLKEGGADEQDIINARAQYRLTSAEYSKFSKAMDIPQQRERVYVDGLGNVGVGKITPAQDIPKIQPRGLGAKATSKVTPAEREQLLRVPEGTKPANNFKLSTKSVDNSSESGIIKARNNIPATKEEIKAFEDVLKSMGFSDITGFDAYTEDNQYLLEIAQDFGKLQKDFPDEIKGLKLNFGKVSIMTDDDYACYEISTGIIHLNPFYYNKMDRLLMEYATDVSKGYHPKGTNYRATIFHEFGHRVETISNISPKKQIKILFERKFNRYYTRKQADVWIKNGLSTYAAEGHYGDLIAEAFAEHYGSYAPREICEDIFGMLF